MSELSDLYQQVLLDHYRSPRHFGRPAGADREAEGFNPLCGDRMKVFVGLDDDVIRALGFEGSGCAISTASASLMSEALQGKTMAEAERLFEAFHEAVTGGAPDPDVDLGKLAALAGELDATRYEARLANVEKTLGATLALLQQLVSENPPRKTAGDS